MTRDVRSFGKRIAAAAILMILTSVSATADDLATARITRLTDPGGEGWRTVSGEARIENGARTGDSAVFEIHYYGHKRFDPDLKTGDPVILRIEDDPDSPALFSATFSQYRLWPILAALGLAFAAAVGFAAGAAGIRGLVGTLVSVSLLIAALAASLRYDLSPILTVIGTGLIASLLSISFLFRNQPRARKLAAWSISISFLANALLAAGLVRFLKINGQSLEGARDLILSFHTGLTHLKPDQFWQILAASLPIATLGAVFDSAVVLAVSLDEMPADAAGTDLARTAFTIGRDLFTTLFLTLFFAHLGLFAPLWAVAFRTDSALLFLLNSEWIAIGVAHVTASAAGLMFSVLSTATLAPKILRPA